MNKKVVAGVVLACGVAVGLVAYLPGGATHHKSADPFGYLFTNDQEGRGQLALVATKCGTERWPVKTGADYDRNSVNTSARSVTIRQLTGNRDPQTYQQSNRSPGVERQVFRVSATLTQYKLESDGDLHLVLSDGSRTLIAEIPDPKCVATNSRWAAQIQATRTAFLKRYPASSSWHYPRVGVTVTGIGMFDPPHRQTGAAPDDLELHPLISFSG